MEEELQEEQINKNEHVLKETNEELKTAEKLNLERLIEESIDFQDDDQKEKESDEDGDDLFDETTESENDIKETSKEFVEETQEEAQEDFEYQEIKRIMESTLINSAAPESTDNELYYVKMPNFLTIVQKPFNPDSYLEELRAEQEETMNHQFDNNQRIRLRVENTIRWRYVKNSDGTYSKQSNARFLRWSDGSLSLLLGSELFSAVTKNNSLEHTYLSISHENQNLLMSRKRFTKNMAFLPIDTRSSTHKKLTEAIFRGNMKKCSIVEFVNVEDPEKVKREAERIEEEKIRFRRRLQSKRRAYDARYHESPILTVEGLEAEETNRHYSRNMYLDRDADDDDGFIVDDESDETEKVERLHKVKEDGRYIYKKQQESYVNENEHDSSENEHKNDNQHLREKIKEQDNTKYMEDIDQDEEIVKRVGKRRRVVDDEAKEETIEEAILTNNTPDGISDETKIATNNIINNTIENTTKDDTVNDDQSHSN